MASAIRPNIITSNLPPVSRSLVSGSNSPSTSPTQSTDSSPAATSTSTADEPTLISRVCQVFKNLIACIGRCLHTIQTKIKNLLCKSDAPVDPVSPAPAATPNSNSPTSTVPDAPGVYLERRCECLSPRIDFLGTSGRFNIIEKISDTELGNHCSTCNKDYEDYDINVIVKGLNHRVQFLESTGNRQDVDTHVVIGADEVRTHLLPSNVAYRYYDVIV